LGAGDFDGGDRGTFQRGQQDAAQRVADGVTITPFERFGGELGEGVGGGFVIRE